MSNQKEGRKGLSDVAFYYVGSRQVNQIKKGTKVIYPSEG
tara:strand:+ start:1139 stop:1258 length:120 start_codon:yes stop_codon:yes gene_type:complete